MSRKHWHDFNFSFFRQWNPPYLSPFLSRSYLQSFVNIMKLFVWPVVIPSRFDNPIYVVKIPLNLTMIHLTCDDISCFQASSKYSTFINGFKFARIFHTFSSNSNSNFWITVLFRSVQCSLNSTTWTNLLKLNCYTNELIIRFSVTIKSEFSFGFFFSLLLLLLLFGLLLFFPFGHENQRK